MYRQTAQGLFGDRREFHRVWFLSQRFAGRSHVEEARVERGRRGENRRRVGIGIGIERGIGLRLWLWLWLHPCGRARWVALEGKRLVGRLGRRLVNELGKRLEIVVGSVFWPPYTVPQFLRKIMLSGFKEFILRGNVVDLAVGVVIGAAFTAIVTSLVTNIFNPIIGAIFNAESLNKALIVSIPTLSGGPANLMFGAFIASTINFLIVALVVYFAIVLPINHLSKVAFARAKNESTATPADVPPTETELLIQIRDLLAGRPSLEGDHAPRT